MFSFFIFLLYIFPFRDFSVTYFFVVLSAVQLAICIEKKRQLSKKYQDGDENKDRVSARVEVVLHLILVSICL